MPQSTNPLGKAYLGVLSVPLNCTTPIVHEQDGIPTTEGDGREAVFMYLTKKGALITCYGEVVRHANHPLTPE